MTPIEPISDEQLAELESIINEADDMYPQRRLYQSLIARLLAAEADVARRGKAISDILTQVDLNIRPTVRDIINGIPDANDIYGYCERIEQIALDALEHKP